MLFSCWVASDSSQLCGPKPSRLLCPWDSPGQNTGVGCRFLLQGIFPTQGIKPASLALAGGFLTAKPSEKHKYMHTYVKNCNRIERFNINKSSFSIIMSFQRHSIHTQANMWANDLSHLLLYSHTAYYIPCSATMSFKKMYKFIYFNWRLITLQYCIGFAIHCWIYFAFSFYYKDYLSSFWQPRSICLCGDTIFYVPDPPLTDT